MKNLLGGQELKSRLSNKCFISKPNEKPPGRPGAEVSSSEKGF
jgi:hypothetical protein